jgi:hypothetical protein
MFSHLLAGRCAADVDLEDLADQTAGYSGNIGGKQRERCESQKCLFNKHTEPTHFTKS